MDTRQLEKFAKRCRRQIVEFKTRSGHGHLASTLSLVEILVSVYLDPDSGFDAKKDVLIFGKAHGGPAVYPILSHLGFFPENELEKYCENNGILRLHPDWSIPGCDFVGGSLGNAIGYAAGRALAERSRRFIVVMGDAELYEGSVWESLMFIAHHKLQNLTVVIDRNGLGTIGFTEKLLALEPLVQKFEAFGIETRTVDGHNFNELRVAFGGFISKPSCIIAKTIKSKGVSFMEGIPEYHTKFPTDSATVAKMLADLT